MSNDTKVPERSEPVNIRSIALIVLAVPEIRRWNATDRHALVEVIRAKGGPRESDFVQRFDAHRRLRRALASLAPTAPNSPVS